MAVSKTGQLGLGNYCEAVDGTLKLITARYQMKALGYRATTAAKIGLMLTMFEELTENELREWLAERLEVHLGQCKAGAICEWLMPCFSHAPLGLLSARKPRLVINDHGPHPQSRFRCLRHGHLPSIWSHKVLTTRRVCIQLPRTLYLCLPIPNSQDTEACKTERRHSSIAHRQGGGQRRWSTSDTVLTSAFPKLLRPACTSCGRRRDAWRPFWGGGARGRR
jgi:hypothetical protein